MKTRHNSRTFLGVVFAAVLAISLFTGCATKNDDSSQARSKLGAIPEFHPEMGLGALQGYLRSQGAPGQPRLDSPASTRWLGRPGAR